MSDTPSGSFTTRKRALLDSGEVSWGGNASESWSDAIESSSGVTITNSGNVQTGSTMIDDFEGGNINEYTGDTTAYCGRMPTPSRVREVTCYRYRFKWKGDSYQCS